MNIRFANHEDLGAILRLNDRLREAGSRHQLMLDPTLPGEAEYRPFGFPVYRRWLIAEDVHEVRAGMQLHHTSAYFYGEQRDFCWTDSPISEGIINRKYSLAMVQLMKGALSYQPFLMALGAGAPDVDVFRFMVKLGWRNGLIPFYFYPARVTRVLRGLEYLRQRPLLRAASLPGAFLGGGALVGTLLHARRALGSRSLQYQSSIEPLFDDWADWVFTNSVHEYAVATRSDATSLNISYAPDNPSFTRIRVRAKNKREMGWVLVTQKRMRDHRFFGNLTVGTLADGFGRLADVPALINAGAQYLIDAGVDLVVANFAHEAWTRACRANGLLPGPTSHFYLFVSQGGAPLLGSSCPLSDIHVCRGHSGGLWDLVEEAGPARRIPSVRVLAS